jgi:PPM family protein phosphatase
VFEFIRELFKKRKPASVNVATAPLSEEQLRSVSYVPTNYRPPQLIVGCGQSVGKVRDHNEDTLFTMTAVLSDNETELPFGLFMVADGMGGHQHGEVASGTAVRTMAEYLVNRIYSPLFGIHAEGQRESLQELMQSGVYEAQQAVLRKAPGGGTTLSVAMVIGEQITISHVGDSRIYFIYPDGRVQVITHDHSLVRRLVELGQITEEEAAVHPQRNVLYRAVGQVEPFKPDVNTHPFPSQGILMLCSDGLWGVVPEAEILRIIRSNNNLTHACNDLINAGNASGGPDNISVILVQCLN